MMGWFALSMIALAVAAAVAADRFPPRGRRWALRVFGVTFALAVALLPFVTDTATLDRSARF